MIGPEDRRPGYVAPAGLVRVQDETGAMVWRDLWAAYSSPHERLGYAPTRVEALERLRAWRETGR